MKASLPCNESEFEANNAEEYHTIASRDGPSPSLSLVDVVQDLISDAPENSQLAQLSAFPLFLAIIGGFRIAVVATEG